MGPSRKLAYGSNKRDSVGPLRGPQTPSLYVLRGSGR